MADVEVERERNKTDRDSKNNKKTYNCYNFLDLWSNLYNKYLNYAIIFFSILNLKSQSFETLKSN